MAPTCPPTSPGQVPSSPRSSPPSSPPPAPRGLQLEGSLRWTPRRSASSLREEDARRTLAGRPTSSAAMSARRPPEGRVAPRSCVFEGAIGCPRSAGAARRNPRRLGALGRRARRARHDGAAVRAVRRAERELAAAKGGCRRSRPPSLAKQRNRRYDGAPKHRPLRRSVQRRTREALRAGATAGGHDQRRRLP